jgi:hypothetical protein
MFDKRTPKSTVNKSQSTKNATKGNKKCNIKEFHANSCSIQSNYIHAHERKYKKSKKKCHKNALK